MPTEPASPPFDVGLLSPISVGVDASLSDAAVADALVTAEVALVRALSAVGAVDTEAAAEVSESLGWSSEGIGCRGHGVSAEALAGASTGGNPVIALVPMLRERVPTRSRAWVHRGATSQDILDTALVLVARRAAADILHDLRRAEGRLTALAQRERDHVAVARTLTQHALPTTVGARVAGWVRSIRRSIQRLDAAAGVLPAQLGGAAGTLAAFADEFGDGVAAALPEAFARELDLAAPEAPWHTERWPITELGDALTQVVDALGTLAADVATLSRSEIAEVSEGEGGGSSSMPQKSNPVASVLIRSAAVRAPYLGATLHAAAASAVDERPDGAWHAEWATLRELLRVTRGASVHAAALAEGLRVHPDAITRNLATAGPLLVSERLRRVLYPRIGEERFAALLEGADAAGLAERVFALPEAADLDVAALLDPAGYTGLARRFVDDLTSAEEDR